jgi:hypothetical protein
MTTIEIAVTLTSLKTDNMETVFNDNIINGCFQ